MITKMTKAQLEEIEAAYSCESKEAAYALLKEYAGLEARPYTAYDFYDEYGNIVDAGWRKASEVASDIFAELDSLMLDGEIGGKYPAKVINPDKYYTLKEKRGGNK